MTAFSDETGRDWLPLKYEDGPDFCTVTFATGAAFALTVHPERMKLMEAALSASPVGDDTALMLKGANLTISDIEKRFPNWESFRDLVDCIDCTLHELRGSPSAPVAQEPVAGVWLPIDTAPKDGTPIDVWADGRRFTNVQWGRHDADSDVPFGPEHWRGTADLVRHGKGTWKYRNPTHWMPRPSAPTCSRQVVNPPATPAGLGADEIARAQEQLASALNGALCDVSHDGVNVTTELAAKAVCTDRVKAAILALLSRAGDQK